MRQPTQFPHRGPNRLVVFYLKLVLFPVVAISLSVKYLMLGIALLTPVDWNEEEEQLLRVAIWKGYHPRQLVFAFWRREKDIAAKARDMGLI